MVNSFTNLSFSLALYQWVRGIHVVHDYKSKLVHMLVKQSKKNNNSVFSFYCWAVEWQNKGKAVALNYTVCIKQKNADSAGEKICSVELFIDRRNMEQITVHAEQVITYLISKCYSFFLSAVLIFGINISSVFHGHSVEVRPFFFCWQMTYAGTSFGYSVQENDIGMAVMLLASNV